MERPGARAEFERTAELLTARALNWWIWKVIVPAALLIALWPIYGQILALPHPFQAAFAHGDLMLFSALMLMELTLEGDHLLWQPLRFRVVSALGKAGAVILMFVYGFLKYDSIMKENRLAALGPKAVAAVPILDKLRSYACLNCSVALLVMIGSSYMLWALLSQQHEAELERFGLV